MRHIRHNHPNEGTFLRRDSGGWIKIHDLPEFFINRDMGPINEYVKRNEHLFGSTTEAAMGAYIACFSGESGNRISILMAVRAIADGKTFAFENTFARLLSEQAEEPQTRTRSSCASHAST